MSFVKNARIMLIGFAVAQVLPLLASPLLTRLFPPEAFGLQTLFVSTTSVLLVLATLRLDLATVVANDRDEAMQIVSLAAIQTAVVALILLGLAMALAPLVAESAGYASGATWVWLVAPMVAVLAAVQISTGLLTWLKRFGPASQAQVVNQASYLAVAIGLGLWSSSLDGLVWAKFAGQALAAAVLLCVLRGSLTSIRIPPRADRPRLWRRCRPFLVFNTPYSMIGLVGREVPVFAFSAVAATAAAGYYGLARTMLGAPATLLAASLSQVFYREAAEHRGTARLQDLTFGLLRVTMTATAPVFALILVWGDIGFSLVFGDHWATAGRYAMMLALPAWLGIQTAWPERMYESVGRQRVSFAIQITFDTLTAAAVFATVLTNSPDWTTVAVFAAINTAFHLSYLTGIIKVAGFPSRRLAGTLGVGLAALGALAALAAAIRLALPTITGFLVAVVLAVAIGGALAVRGYRSVHVLAGAAPDTLL